MPKDLKYQKKLVKRLNRNNDYENASIYTILLGLVEGNGIDEVFMILHNVATDLKKREKLESQFEKAKSWKW